MNTKYINDKINEIFDNEEYKELSKETVDKLFSLMKGFEFEDNDDFRLLLSRIHQGFLVKFNIEWGRYILENMNDDFKHDKNIL